MPNELDSAPESQGTNDEDLLGSSTAGAGEEADLLGEEAAQSKDIGHDTPEDEETRVPGDIFDESARALLAQDPDRGMALLQEKINRFVKGQNKAFTKRMSKLAKEGKDKDAIVQQWQALDSRMKQLYMEDPDFVQMWLKKVKGDTAQADTPKPKNPIRTTTDLLKEVREMIREEIGGLRGVYHQDKATETVDSFLRNAKNPKLNAKRDELVRVKSEHPEYSLKQTLAVVDPDLLGDLLVEARRRKSMPEGGARELSAFTMKGKPKKYDGFDDAFTAAIAEHGDPERMTTPD